MYCKQVKIGVTGYLKRFERLICNPSWNAQALMLNIWTILASTAVWDRFVIPLSGSAPDTLSPSQHLYAISLQLC